MNRLLKNIRLFCKKPYERDGILQKRPMFSRSLLIIATPNIGQSLSYFISCPRFRFCLFCFFHYACRDIGQTKRHEREAPLEILTCSNHTLFVAVYCSVMQYVAVCCSALQCVAVCWGVLQRVAVCCGVLRCAAVYCSVLQCVAVCCSVLQYIAA